MMLIEKHAAGAEGNVAIRVSRLRVSSGIISRVGDNEFGGFPVGMLQTENVDTTHVTIDRGSSTAVFLKEPDKAGNRVNLFYTARHPLCGHESQYRS